MINIICGDFDQGKSAKIRSIYTRDNNGDGFISQKIFMNSIFCGYNITRLSTGESVPLSLKTELYPLDMNPLYTCGSFSFFKDGFSFASSIIDDIILNNTSPVFMDEIGPLELSGKGHYDSLIKILKTDKTIYITVRTRCVKDVISFFSLNKYALIRI